MFDVIDTEGMALPRDAACFSAYGSIDKQRVAAFKTLLSKKSIEWCWVDAGDPKGWLDPAYPTCRKGWGSYTVPDADQ